MSLIFEFWKKYRKKTILHMDPDRELLITSWLQADFKLNASWLQADYKLITSWFQPDYRLITTDYRLITSKLLKFTEITEKYANQANKKLNGERNSERT